MSQPTIASLKKVTPENLARLGLEALADILADVADGQPDLKRRLKMELAAAQGGEHLALELDRRLDTHASSRSRVSWRKRPGFVADLEVLRALITDRLGPLDRSAALERLWRLLEVARPLGSRVKDKHGELEAVFRRAAGDIGRLSAPGDSPQALALALDAHPLPWIDWLPGLIAEAPTPYLAAALTLMQATPGKGAYRGALMRLLADAAGDIEAFRASFTAEALKKPEAAAALARRLLEAGRAEEAGQVLEAARPAPARAGLFRPGAAVVEPDFEWESAWIAFLDAAGRAEEAQGARWAAFERTLSVERARDFTRRLPEFEDVEAEGRAFDFAARHPDATRGLRFLIEWPALPEAAKMIAARADELSPAPAEAEAWAGRLRIRQPAAANTLLRKAAAAAFARRDFATCDRLTQEADSIEAP
jgi:hypothetical protein